MKRWGTILCLCLLPMLLFSACAEATAQVDFVANKDVKKIFDDVHTVGYILDDIRKVDLKNMNHTDRMKQNGKNQKTGGRHFSACRCGKDDAGRGNFI